MVRQLNMHPTKELVLTLDRAAVPRELMNLSGEKRVFICPPEVNYTPVS